MPAEPYGAAEIGPMPGVRPGCVEQRMVRQERRQVRPDPDRPDARPAAAVRDAERLVQVEVADVRAEPARLGQSEQRVQVGAVDVDLAAGVVHQRAQVDDGLLEHPVGRRVGDHDRGQLVAVRLDLGPQVVQIDRAVVGGLDHDHLHPGHHRRGRVGAVRRGRDQADPPVMITAGVVVGPDGQQPGELALAAGVRLDRDLGVAGHLGEPGLQLVDQRRVALRVLDRRERVQRRRSPGRRSAPSRWWR